VALGQRSLQVRGFARTLRRGDECTGPRDVLIEASLESDDLLLEQCESL
jgi:hypothetical protein